MYIANDPNQPAKRPRVLIADDEPVIRHMVRRVLARRYTVLEAEDGAQALRIARDFNPAVILMDLMMPRMDGLTASCALKADRATRDIPVIMLTALDYQLNAKISQQIIGAAGYITKPFPDTELLAVIGRALGEKPAAVAPEP